MPPPARIPVLLSLMVKIALPALSVIVLVPEVAVNAVELKVQPPTVPDVAETFPVVDTLKTPPLSEMLPPVTVMFDVVNAPVVDT